MPEPMTSTSKCPSGSEGSGMKTSPFMRARRSSDDASGLAGVAAHVGVGEPPLAGGDATLALEGAAALFADVDGVRHLDAGLDHAPKARAIDADEKHARRLAMVQGVVAHRLREALDEQH